MALNQPAPKHISFSTPLHIDIPNQLQHMPKPALKATTPQKLAHSQDHHTSTPTTVNVWDIVALKKHLQHHLTQSEICPAPTPYIDPSIPPVQHTQRKVPIEYHEQIEKSLQNMVNPKVIAPVIKPMEWVSSLTYPHKPNGTLFICLDPHN